MLTPDDLDQWRKAHGDFVYPTIVLVRTGQAAHRDDLQRYWGTPDAYQLPSEVDFSTVDFPELHFPGELGNIFVVWREEWVKEMR